MVSNKDLKKRVLKGGIYLTFRQVIVSVLSLANILVIARVLGPSLYGIVTVSLGIFYFLNRVFRLGLHVYLIRQPNLSDDMPKQILAFYNTVGAGVCFLFWFTAPVFGLWTGNSEVTLSLRILLPALWLCSISWVFTSVMERELRFAEVGLIEAICQIVYSAFSIGLVLLGCGYLGPIIGTVALFLSRTFLAYYLQPIPLSIRWDWKSLKPALQYSLTYSGSDWMLSVKDLRVSLLVSRVVGIDSAGIIGIAIRLVDQLSMLRLVVRRMSISVMAKIVDDPDKTRDTISRSMAYQALLIGPLCAFFSCISAWIIPIMFDERWLASTRIFPFIALGSLISSIFDLHTSTLYASGTNRDVARLNFVYVGCLWIVSALLMPTLELWGYAIAEVVALPAFYLIHRSITRQYGSPSYWNALYLILAAVVPLFSGMFLPPILGSMLFVCCYALVFLLCSDIRDMTLELVSVSRSR
jgi:PST family polysaccharide transporter